MKLSCNTIQDVLPLVVEDLASDDTVKLINEHIENCPECSKEYEELKASKIDYKAKNELESIPLKDVKRKLKNRNVYIGVLTALIISLLLFIGLDKVTKPIPLLFGQAIDFTQVEDGKVFIKFKPEVSNYSIVSSNYDGIDYEIMAWETNVSNLFERGEAKTTVISVDEEEPVSVRFISQGSELDTWIYGKKQERHSLTLPRLAMNYYLYIMGIIFLISLVLSFMLRKMDKIRKIINIIMILALSYISAHMVIFGIGGVTHHMNRDLSFVIIATILFFTIFILSMYKENFMKTKEDISK